MWRVRADLQFVLGEMHEELTPKDKDATTRHAGEADGQTLAETAGSPGRNTSAGHMKLANVLVFVGMNPELRKVAEIRSKSVSSTSPSGWYCQWCRRRQHLRN